MVMLLSASCVNSNLRNLQSRVKLIANAHLVNECNSVGAADCVIVQHASKASRGHTILIETTKDSYKHGN